MESRKRLRGVKEVSDKDEKRNQDSNLNFISALSELDYCYRAHRSSIARNTGKMDWF